MYGRLIINIWKLKINLLISGLLLTVLANAQDTLSHAQAVAIMLENNYGIKIAKNNLMIAENNTSKALNGFYPTLNATAAANADLGNSSQQFSSGFEANVKNAFSWRGNAALNANYTIFDKRRDAVLGQLKEQIDLADFEIRQTIEANLLQLFTAYYEVARYTENLKAQSQTMSLSRQRLLRAQYAYEYGQGIRLDLLNAEVDIQRDSINFLNIKQFLANSKRNLNVIMGRSVEIGFEVDTEINYTKNLSLENLLDVVQNKNINVLITDKNMAISNHEFDILAAERKPVIAATAGYSLSYQKNAEEAFITSQNSSGLGVGLNISWNIFDGGVRKARKENTIVSIHSQGIQRRQLLAELERDVTNAWESYQNALLVLDVENNSLATNQLNFERTEELYKSGQINSVEFRLAQLNLLNAAINYNTAKFDAKVIEIQLLQLSGELLDQEF